MNPRALYKYGGVALIAGSALNFAYLLSSITMTDNHKTLAAAISSIGNLLMLVGLYVTYSRIRAKNGTLGKIGFAFIAASLGLQTGNAIFELSLYSQIVADSPVANLLTYDSTIQENQSVFLLRNAILITSIIGVLLFSLAIHRSRSYPKSAPPLIIAGTIGGFIWPVYPIVFSVASIFSYTIGYLIIGFHLSKSSDQSAV